MNKDSDHSPAIAGAIGQRRFHQMKIGLMRVHDILFPFKFLVLKFYLSVNFLMNRWVNS